MKKILITTILLFSSFLTTNLSLAWYVDIPWATEIEKVSNDIKSTWDINNDIKETSYSIIKLVKVFLQWFVILFIVYAWVRMIISMWDNDEEISSAKRQLWYWVIAITVINIPWAIYEAFHPTNLWNIDTRIDNTWFKSVDSGGNMFLNTDSFLNTFWENIIWFLEILIGISAVFVIIMAGIKMIISRWREDQLKESKSKIIYSILALLFLGFVEAWRNVAFDINIKKWVSLFWDLANIALFIAWPVAIFFLSLARYYFIMSWWNEEYVKKAKSIVTNTIIATIILLVSYTFLLDLADLKF